MRQQAKADNLTILKCLRIHSYFENIMTKFVIDNRTDAYVNLLILFSRFCHSFFYLLKGTNFRDKNNFFGPSFDPQFVVEGRPGLPFPFIGFTAEHKTRPLMLLPLIHKLLVFYLFQSTITYLKSFLLVRRDRKLS